MDSRAVLINCVGSTARTVRSKWTVEPCLLTVLVAQQGLSVKQVQMDSRAVLINCVGSTARTVRSKWTVEPCLLTVLVAQQGLLDPNGQ